MLLGLLFYLLLFDFTHLCAVPLCAAAMTVTSIDHCIFSEIPVGFDSYFIVLPPGLFWDLAKTIAFARRFLGTIPYEIIFLIRHEKYRILQNYIS